jgi:hypothetical protein
MPASELLGDADGSAARTSIPVTHRTRSPAPKERGRRYVARAGSARHATARAQADQREEVPEQAAAA